MCDTKSLDTCFLCDRPKKMIRAHILSKRFFKALKKDDKYDFYIYNNNKMGRTKSGIFDENILCQKCDNSFSEYENETIKLLKLDLSQYECTIEENGHKASFFLIPHNLISSEKIMMFFISLLWKSSISKRKEFSKISLGKYEKFFKEALKNRKIPDVIDVTMSYFSDNATGKETISLPAKGRNQEGINYYEFYFNGFDIRIKVDKRKKNPFIISSLKNRDGIIILKRNNFQNSNYRKDLIRTVKKNN